VCWQTLGAPLGNAVVAQVLDLKNHNGALQEKGSLQQAIPGARRLLQGSNFCLMMACDATP
jgi:hypothetical protein